MLLEGKTTTMCPQATGQAPCQERQCLTAVIPQPVAIIHETYSVATIHSPLSALVPQTRWLKTREVGPIFHPFVAVYLGAFQPSSNQMAE